LNPEIIDVRVGVLLLLTVICIYTDIKYRKIYNHFTFSGMMLGFGFNGIMNGGQGLFFAGTGFLAGGAILLLFFLAGGVGAGDVKYLAACGALMGPRFIFRAAVSGIILGGVAVFVFMLLTGRLSRLITNVYFIIKESVSTGKLDVTESQDDKVYIPYGLFLGIGVIIGVIETGFIH